MDKWRPTWAGSIRVRLVATMIALLVPAGANSILLFRVALLGDLNEEIEEHLAREIQEFRLLT